MGTLYTISGDLAAIEALLDEAQGDITGHEQTIERWLEEAEGARDDKLDRYAALIRECEARADTRRAEAKRLTDRAKVDENKAEGLKRTLKWFFEAHELKRIETPRFKLTLAKNGGRAGVEVLAPPEELPPEFVRTKREPDVDAIRTALEAGQFLPFATLKERGHSIRIG